MTVFAIYPPPPTLSSTVSPALLNLRGKRKIMVSFTGLIENPCVKEQPVKVKRLVNFNYPQFWIGLSRDLKKNLEISNVCETHILLSIPCNGLRLYRGFYLRFSSPPPPHQQTQIFGWIVVKVSDAPPSVVLNIPGPFIYLYHLLIKT